MHKFCILPILAAIGLCSLLEMCIRDRYVHIHIEEAELSLDPEAQRALISNLVDEAFHKMCIRDRNRIPS